MIAAEPVRVAVLGPVRAWVGDRQVELGGRRHRSLLARLALAHGQVVSVDRLIDDLWEGEPPPKALSALQVYVSHLRRALEPDRERRSPARVIVSAAPGYCLKLPVEAVDAWRIESEVLAAQDEPDLAARLELLDGALSGWSGDAFAEVADASWAFSEVARLTELRLAAVEWQAAAQSALGRDAKVVHTLDRHVRDHPDREGAACLLAAALYRSGRQAEALKVLRRSREHLVNHLGLEPGRPLRDLEGDILRQADHLGVASSPPQPRPAPIDVQQVRRAATHGRNDELAVIDGAAREAVSSGARIVWIGGEAGAGKTTLAEEAAAALKAAGWHVAWGRCPEVDGAPAGWAWTEVLGAFDSLDKRTELEPLLHQKNNRREPGTFWLAHALADLLAEAAARRPLAVILDDLHRTDGLTLELLRLVTDRLGSAPVLVIGTYRPSEAGIEMESARAALANCTAGHLSLAGLGTAATAALAADCGLTMVSGETLRLLLERTGGNPLFVRELARLMAAEGIDAVRQGVPIGVRDVVRRRVARLPGPTVTALRQAAVLGREVDPELLAELARRDLDDVLDALEPAVLVGLLDEPQPGRLRFAHSLIRDTLYEDTSMLRRNRLHASALELLRAPNRSTDAGSLAHHAVASATAGTASEAALFAENAAREAEAVGAAVEASRQWRSVVRMLELAASRAAPQDIERGVSARCGLISALARAGDAVAARDELKRTLAMASSDELTVRALTAWDAPLVWRVRITDEVDEAIVSPLRQVLRTELPRTVRARLLATLFAELEGAEPEAALAASGQALALARELHFEDPHAHGRLLCAALNARAYAALGPDVAGERESTASELLAVAEAAGEIDYEAVAHWLLFLSAASRSDLAIAQRHVDLAVAHAGTGQLGHLLTVVEVFTAQLNVLAGRTDEGQERYTAAAARLSEHGIANGSLMALVGRITTALARGEVGSMADELVSIHDTVSVAVCDVAVLALLASGRGDEARRLWAGRPGVERSYYWLAMTTLRAHAAAQLGDVDAARRCAEELTPYSGRMAGLDNGSLLAGPVDDALAAVAELSGQSEDARRYRSAADALRDRLAADATRLLSS